MVEKSDLKSSVEKKLAPHMMEKSFTDPFHDEEILRASTNHWYAKFSNYLAKGILPPQMQYEERKSFFTKLKTYTWEDPFLYKECSDRIIRKCVMDYKIQTILEY